jgi:hypothetical protein
MNARTLLSSVSRLVCLSAVLAAALLHAAPVPSPDKLLAGDTLAVLTVPDAAKARRASQQSPAGLLWKDAAMRPFREKLMNKLTTEVIEPLEREMGVKFADYEGLAQGQFTIAVTPPASDKGGKAPGFLILMDARDKSEALKTNLTSLRKKWVDAGKQIKTDKIRDVEFTTLIFSGEDVKKSLGKVLPVPGGGGGDKDKDEAKMEWIMGQSGTLLVLGTSAKDIEKILIRQSGGGVPSLGEQGNFSASYNSMLRDSLAYGWLNAKTVIEMLTKMISTQEAAGEENQMGPQIGKIVEALGFKGLQALAFNVRDLPEGSMMQFHVAVPESARRGLFKIIAWDAKEASPPPFIPADAVKFSRTRLDLTKAWSALEQTVVEAMPQMAGVIKLLVDNAGKDKDPNFDLRKNLIANLGDDVVSYEKAPRTQTLDNLNSPPAIYLISSPRAEELASSFKALGSIVPQRGSKMKEREFLGRTVYVMSFTMPGGPQGKGVDKTLSYAASGGYLALSFDVAMLEEYLRSGGTAGKPLREIPGLTEAAQKVGGMGTGLFGYENNLETMRALVEILKKESGTLANLFSSSPFSGRFGLGGDGKKLEDWVDFSLLPSFDKISKYLHYTVYSGVLNAEGMTVKFFGPNPPQMKK